MVPTKVQASSHADFQKLIFDEDSLASLIEDMPQEKIQKAYKSMKRRVFGWNYATIIKNEAIKYEGDIVFSKANNTNRELSFTYNYETENTFETSVSVTGELSISISGKIKAINGTLNGKIRKEIGEKTHKKMTESTRTTLVVPPSTKLTVQIKGDARLSNGVARYHFLGIGFKKGTWEIIDVITEYYDYYEESI